MILLPMILPYQGIDEVRDKAHDKVWRIPHPVSCIPYRRVLAASAPPSYGVSRARTR